MALSIEQIFDAVAPIYKNETDKEVYFSMAAGRTSSCAYGTNYNMAVALRAAHLMELAKGTDFSGSGAAGPVTGKKEGQLSISYGAGSSETDGSDLSMTKYGKQLQGLSRGNIAAVGVTGGGITGCS